MYNSQDQVGALYINKRYGLRMHLDQFIQETLCQLVTGMLKMLPTTMKVLVQSEKFQLYSLIMMNAHLYKTSLKEQTLEDQMAVHI